MTEEFSSAVEARIARNIAKAVNARVEQVAAAVALLDDGATVPFIARYRKEATGGLDDTQLRMLEEQLIYGRELEERRAAILKSLADSGKLTEDLKKQIEEADAKQRLEDLYLPYKPKRRTRAQIAKEAGLEPLAEALITDPALDPQQEANKYINAEKGVADVKAALDGARDILAERFAENADMLEMLREFLWNHADLVSSVLPEVENSEQAAKYRDYFHYREAMSEIPSHRALAVFRGRQEGVLTLKMLLSEEEEALPVHPCQQRIAGFLRIEGGAHRFLSVPEVVVTVPGELSVCGGLDGGGHRAGSRHSYGRKGRSDFRHRCSARDVRGLPA